MAKIAVTFESATGADGPTSTLTRDRRLASGDGWSVSDVICAAGPHDRPFEEQYSHVCIALVLGGSFQYRSSLGRELMTPGSLLLGNAGQCFECSHEHGSGDRCISFTYDSRYFESVIDESEVPSRAARFSSLRVPPLREFSGLAARAAAGSVGATLEDLGPLWQEIALELAVRAFELSLGRKTSLGTPPAAEARVTRAVRLIDSHPGPDHTLDSLARETRLSRFHFLRIFQQLTGLTPHQYLLRSRLRLAAQKLILEPAPVLDVAFESGFGDVSNFNHAFRAEFGTNPRTYRQQRLLRSKAG